MLVISEFMFTLHCDLLLTFNHLDFTITCKFYMAVLISLIICLKYLLNNENKVKITKQAIQILKFTQKFHHFKSVL